MAEWLAASAETFTAIFAGIALYAWRAKLRGGSKHAAAAEIAEAASLLRLHFYDARNPLYDVQAEFPAAYNSQTLHTNRERVRAWAYLFNNRYEQLKVHILRIATLRAKAAALLSNEASAALGELAKKARELHGIFQQKVQQEKLGDAMDEDPKHHEWIERIDSRVKVEDPTVPPGDHTDPYSIEFEQRYTAVVQLLRPYL